ncbi:NmrA/HSCARG family protein [Rapidithrix thailandica]|uniref:NmrA/HSCARG family protein n=1 Tax=Rapidithrix thailandica TaxID=413964 RepID=A0AAW9S2U6_9BACT
MNSEQAILVTGATGQQGGAVARQLLAKGFSVKAMTRNVQSDKAKTLARLGAVPVEADLDDSASLKKALKGIWGVFSVQNSWGVGVEQEEVQGKNLAKLCKEEGVRHLVYTSVASAHKHTGIPHFENKWRIEETIRKLGLPSFTILRPVFFMENFQSPWYKPGIEEGKLAMSLKATTSLQMIALEDIGKYGALAFEKSQELNGKAIDIAGDECTMMEVTAVLSSVTGKKIEYVQVPIEEVRKMSEDFALMFEWFEKVGYDVDIDQLARDYGIQPIQLTEWAKRSDW